MPTSINPPTTRQPPSSSPTPCETTAARRRKKPVHKRKPNASSKDFKNVAVEELKKHLKKRLKLRFMPDDWQCEFIRKILQGYDGMLCAGTGYGKSLIFEGLAALGGPESVVVIISPLKALERDQVCPDWQFRWISLSLTLSRPFKRLKKVSAPSFSMRTPSKRRVYGSEQNRRPNSSTAPRKWRSVPASQSYGPAQIFGAV